MICPPFLVPTQIDRITNANAMPDSRYNIYSLIDSHFVQHHKLKHVLIKKQKVFTYDDYPGEAVEAVVKLEINIRGVWRCGFVYKVHQIKD
jgi:hypothetical protein